MTEEFQAEMKKQGYFLLMDLPGHGVCGVRQFLFTVGLCYGLDDDGYVGRYCFQTRLEAMESMVNWEEAGDPPGNWIKHKGRTEYSNPNLNKS